MKYLPLILLVVAFTCFTESYLIAQGTGQTNKLEVSENEAKEIAINFFAAQQFSLKSLSLNSLQTKRIIHENTGNEETDQPLFYVFEKDENGFVIIAGNRTLPPIIGYSLETNANSNELPPQLLSMLENYGTVQNENGQSENQPLINKQWQNLQSGNLELNSGEIEIQPLITSKWGQGWPYNKFCPEDSNGSSGHTLAGCNAVAIAQILNYWKFPEKAHGEVNYSSGTYGFKELNFEDEEYDFSAMDNEDVIARLIYHSALATKSKFGIENTTSNQSELWNALVKHFNYSPSAHNFGICALEDLPEFERDLDKELLAERPVIYSAWSKGSDEPGHTFIIDGKDTEGLYHVNWGWNGQYNGYFSLALLNPNKLYDSDTPIMIIGIEPGNNIYENTTWEGTINLEKSVYVANGAILTIEKGTTIKSAKKCMIRVDGAIKANGEKNDSIRFTAVNEDDGWFGLSIYPTKKNINDTCSFKYCIIEKCLFHVGGKYHCSNAVTAIHITLRDKVIIENCLIQNINGFDVATINLYGYPDPDKRKRTKAIIKNTTIRNNHQINFGGGLNVLGGEVIMTNSSILNNIINNKQYPGSGSGAGIRVQEGNVIIENCYISNNSVLPNTSCTGEGCAVGGGIEASGSKVLINNCLVSNNQSRKGGAFYISSCDTFIVKNSTIVSNTSNEASAIYFDARNNPHLAQLVNSIIYNNNSNEQDYSIQLGNLANLKLTNVLLPDGTQVIDIPENCSLDTSNIINSNPGFVNEINNDYRLSNNSEAINTGNGFYHLDYFKAKTDLDGNPRVYGGKIDLGAYENQQIFADPKLEIEKDLLEIVVNEAPSESLGILPVNIGWDEIVVSDIPEYANIIIDSIASELLITIDKNKELPDSFLFHLTSGVDTININVLLDNRPVLSGVLNGEITPNNYIITGDIMVESGNKLIISPNTTFAFKNNSALLCQGALHAIDGIDNTIIFKGYKNNLWQGISFSNDIENQDSTLLIGCIFQDIVRSFSLLSDGAVNLYHYSKFRMERCELFNNKAFDGALGIGYSSDATIKNNYFHHNTGDIGSGITVGNSKAVIANNKVFYNFSSSSKGFGIGGSIVIHQVNCEFINKDPLIIANEVAFNEGQQGAGISILTSQIESHPKIVNNLIYKNKSEELGAGMYIVSYYNDMLFPVLINNTIVDNMGGGINLEYSTVALEAYNTILYGNKYINGKIININYNQESVQGENVYPQMHNCNVENGKNSIFFNRKYKGNIYVYNDCLNDDPLFVNPEENNYRIQRPSPLINSGISEIEGFNFPEYDFYNGTRIRDGKIDIGAHEYGCDKNDSIFEEVEICYEESYNGWTTEGEHIETFTSVSGCDSVVTTLLTILDPIAKEEYVTICNGESYLGHSESITFDQTFESSSGCDSVVTTHLTILPLINSSISKTICHGESYKGWTTEGEHTETFTSSSGCDSIVSTMLTILDPISEEEYVTICNGESYLGHNESTSFDQTFESSSGCDSLVTTHLTVLPPNETTEDVTICSGESYKGWNTEGEHIESFTSYSGCDSTVITNLTFYPTFQPEIVVLGDTITSVGTYLAYQWFDESGAISGATDASYIILKSGNYWLQVTDENGCTQTSEGVSIVHSSAPQHITMEFNFSIIPNPNHGKFVLRIDSKLSEELELKLLNSLGQVIEIKKIKNAHSGYLIPFEINNKSKGIYYLFIQTPGNIRTAKINIY